MNDKKFPDIGSNASSGSNADGKPKKIVNRDRLYSVLALIFGAVMAVGILSLLINAKKVFDSGNVSNNNPMIVVSIIVTVAGGLLMSLFIVLSILALIKQGKDGQADMSGGVQYVIAPEVLKDPRIKNLPEVQRLLQYESVQKVFFDGQFPNSPKKLADPHLQELVNVLSQLADKDGVIRL